MQAFHSFLGSHQKTRLTGDKNHSVTNDNCLMTSTIKFTCGMHL